MGPPGSDAGPRLPTPLYDLHVAGGGRMVPFAGYEMPVQFAPGIMAEHLHARSAAGLFDVSHMGQIILRPCSGNTADAALALERLVPVDVLGLGEGRQRYAFFTNEKGRSEEHTSELQSLMRISYAVFCLKKKNKINKESK